MDSRQNSRQVLPLVERYGGAILAMTCTLAIRLAFDPVLQDRAPYMFFILAIVFVTRLWGRGPGLLATVLGGVATWYFILEPRFSFAIWNRPDGLNLTAFFAVGVGVSMLGAPSTPRPSPSARGDWSIKARVVRQTAVLAGAAVVLAGMVFLLLRGFSRTHETQTWVVHTYRVINSAESLLSTMKSAETEERGFLLTGDPEYRTSYEAAVAVLPENLKQLKELTAGNPVQQERSAEIERLAEARRAALERAIALRTTMGVEAAMAVVRSSDARQTMEALRSATDAVVSEEDSNLVGRTIQAEEQNARAGWVLGLGSTALILLLVFASVVIEQETVRREKLASALHRHANLLEQAHDSLLICGLRGPIEYWGHGAELLFGYSREEALGHLPHELLRTTHSLGMEEIDAQLERDGQWKGELTQTTKDGRQLIVEAQWTVAAESAGRKLVLEANRDITERKRAEAERLLLATAIEQAAETVVITDREAKIQYANPAFERSTGYTRAEVQGENPRVLKSGQQDPEFYRRLWATISSGKLWHGEFTNRRKDGTLYVEDATIAPVRDPAGEITNYIAIKSDVTERKQAEARLRESERMLRFFVRHAPAAIAMLDEEMRYLVVSHRWMSDYHLVNRNIIGLSHYEVFPEISERWKKIHRQCLAGAVERCEEDPFPREDGRTDWVRWEVRPWRRIDDSIGGIIIFSELITERKLAEEALKQSEHLLRESQRVGRIGSYDLDITTGRWTSSAVLDDIFGIEGDYPKDVEGWLALIHPSHRAEMRAYLGEVVGGKKRFERDYRIIRPSDRAERWVSGKGELIFNAASSAVRMIGTIQDVTERKKAEAAVEESELRYRQLFERSESALALHEIILDSEGTPRDYRFLDVNPAFERNTGLRRSQVLGRRALEILPGLEEFWIKLYGGVATTGEPASFENFTRALGRFYAGSAYSPRPHQFAVSFMDVTERKRAEDELYRLNVELEERVRARTAELEAANRELEAFAHSVSHDLRAPLRGIDGWSLALLEDYGDRLDEQGHKYLGRVRSEAQRMGGLIDDLLHLSRVSRAEMAPETVDLSCLAETIAARLREAHPDRSIEFVVARDLKCTGDARLLEVALTNMLDNAVKFTAPRPQAQIEFGCTPNHARTAFFVRDNGVGFDMNYAGMLFAPFQRLHKTSEFPGTGIGLATVQRVIHRHGGEIWAEAKVGEGATLFFTLGAEKS